MERALSAAMVRQLFVASRMSSWTMLSRYVSKTVGLETSVKPVCDDTPWNGHGVAPEGIRSRVVSFRCVMRLSDGPTSMLAGFSLWLACWEPQERKPHVHDNA